MRKITTSKKLLAIVCTISFVMTFIVVIAWAILDRQDAAGLAGVVIAPAVTVIGLYIWKAKAENMIKLGWTKEEIKDELDNDI